MVGTKKVVWLVNPYAMPPKYEARIQTLKRAQYLEEAGYDVTIIGGSFLHNTDINLIDDKAAFKRAEYDGLKFIHIRTPGYNKNGIKRMLNLLVFHFRLFFLAGKLGKPDVIAQLATVPFGNIVYYTAKKFKARFIVDVVDLWPESFVAFGLVSPRNPLLKIAYWAEKWLYKRADALVFSMEGGKDYIKEKGWDTESGGPIDLRKVHYINNGVDVGDFEKNKELYKVPDADLENENTFKVVYLGSIRLANNLKQLVDAAAVLLHRKDIQFLIYGDGPDRAYLERYCADKGISNVLFKQKWLELKYIPYILSKSSLNILNYFKSPITRFGGSQSKSFQYMASGKPICANLAMAYCPITKFNLGIAKAFNTAEEYADAIVYFADLKSDEYQQICANAKQAALQYDYRALTARFEKLLA